jgi:hypothetical protein
MPFLDIAAGLRRQLDIDDSLPLPAAVRKMSELMGLPCVREDGSALPLPDQVESLCEALGFSIPLGDAAAEANESEASEPESEGFESQMASSSSAPSISSGKVKEKKQRELCAPL